MGSIFQKSLIEAVANACTLKSHAGDWFDKGKDNRMVYSSAWCMCYDTYHQTMWGSTLVNVLGHGLVDAATAPLAILELGSGGHTTFKNLTAGIVNHKIVYHSVDRNPSPGVLIPRSAIDDGDTANPDVIHESGSMTTLTRTLVEWNKLLLGKDIRVVERPLEHVHHQQDVFGEKAWMDAELPRDRFDVLIVDIEPHGREVELVDMFEPYMKAEYLIIFKCIGTMDLYGSGLADKALRHLQGARKLLDMFAVTGEFELTRDVFAVCARTDTELDGSLYKSLLEKGSLDVYTSSDTVMDSVCVRPSAELVRQLNSETKSLVDLRARPKGCTPSADSSRCAR